MKFVRIDEPMIYINAKTKEFVVAQQRNMSSYTVSNGHALGRFVEHGFEPFCAISGESSVMFRNNGWKQLRAGDSLSKETKADALAYAEAVVAILKHEIK